MLRRFRWEKRRFYRHPIGVPIALRETEEKEQSPSDSLDVSLGGMSFLWPRKLPKGAVIGINIVVKDKLFEIKSKVAYAKPDPKTGKFRTGVCFTDTPSAFTARLAEEMLEILEYRKNLSRERGREITEEEAASEWIKKFAPKFPN